MEALYDIGGYMVALNRIVIIGPIETISPFHDDKVFLFEITLAGAAHPHRFPCKDLAALKQYRADLIHAYNRYKHPPGGQDEAPPPGPLLTLTIGEKCLIYRQRAGLSLRAAGTAAWPDLSAPHQKLTKIEDGRQEPTAGELERLAEALGAPELARLEAPP